jgi:hypothetical protein
MPTLSSDQAFQLAKQFSDIARELTEYRMSNFAELTPDQRNQLEGLEFSIRNFSSDFVALSIKLALDDLDSALRDIKGATDKMKNAIGNLEKVNKILKVATTVVTIGAAIVSGNPAAIASAVGAAFEEDKNKDEDKEEETVNG